MIRRIPIALLLLAAGCSSYTQSKIDLTAQAQMGVTRVREALVVRASDEVKHDRLHERLDDAFDADVAQRDPLTPDWVIEHRKAYAAAIDALHAARRADDARADVAMTQTLDAVSLLLAQLQRMHATELSLAGQLPPQLSLREQPRSEAGR